MAHEGVHQQRLLALARARGEHDRALADARAQGLAQGEQLGGGVMSNLMLPVTVTRRAPSWARRAASAAVCAPIAPSAFMVSAVSAGRRA